MQKKVLNLEKLNALHVSQYNEIETLSIYQKMILNINYHHSIYRLDIILNENFIKCQLTLNTCTLQRNEFECHNNFVTIFK